MKRPWLYYISPIILLTLLAVIFLVLGIADMNKHESHEIIEVSVYAFVILLLLGFDYFIKWITNGRVFYIWLIEAVIIGLLYYLLINSGSFRLSGC